MFSCKGVQNKSIQYTENCFYMDDRYTYLNFYNSKSQHIYIPKIFLPRNEDLTIIDNYYKLRNDTLYLRTPTTDDVSISDAKNPTIAFVKDSIRIKGGMTFKEVFRTTNHFNVISLIADEENFIFEKCLQ